MLEPSLVFHKTRLQEDACWQAFRVFDRDGNGTISQKESNPESFSSSFQSHFFHFQIDQINTIIIGLSQSLNQDLTKKLMPRLAEVLASDDVAGKFHKAGIFLCFAGCGPIFSVSMPAGSGRHLPEENGIYRAKKEL